VARLVSIGQIWTFILGYFAALAALILGPATALHMLEGQRHPPTGLAVAAVALGTGSLLPLVVLIAWMYRRSDEYERHGILLVSTVGFGMALIAMAALDVLARTDLLSGWTWSPRWWTVVACWIVSLIAVRTLRNRDA
jgi:hypothetical protein